MAHEHGLASASGEERDGLTVGPAARLVGVSVKTLHHWDTVALVRPGGRTPAGYRVYSDDDLARIHRVLVYRELGFSLAEIGRILDDPDADARVHLLRQRTQLNDRISHLQQVVDSVDRMLQASSSGIRLTPEQQVEIFGTAWDPAWGDEAAERWGDSVQWVQYLERAAAMTPQDWKEVAAATGALHDNLAAAKLAGVAPGSGEANELAERHRTLMSTYFDCTHAMQVCMGQMFSDDTGFAAYYDAFTPGLSGWLRDVIAANAAANGVHPESATWK